MFLAICLELTECFFLLFHFSNPSHPFVAGLTLEKLSAVTVDDSGKETFVSGGALGRIQKVPLLVKYQILIFHCFNHF